MGFGLVVREQCELIHLYYPPKNCKFVLDSEVLEELKEITGIEKFTLTEEELKVKVKSEGNLPDVELAILKIINKHHCIVLNDIVEFILKREVFFRRLWFRRLARPIKAVIVAVIRVFSKRK